VNFDENGRLQRSDLHVCGALGGTRTPNLLIRSQMLYPIELRAQRQHRTARFGLGEIRCAGQIGWAFDVVHAGIQPIQGRVVVVISVVAV
jgi:hypothetical protein